MIKDKSRYQSALKEAIDYLVGDKVVVEFSLGTRYDQEIKELIKEVKPLGMHSELVALDCKVEECANRLRKAQEDPLYYSSLDLTENILEVVRGVVDSYRMSREMGYLE